MIRHLLDINILFNKQRRKMDMKAW